MTKILVNITLAIVTEEIDNILETYPKYPYQEAFAPSGLRQDLIAYVLNHIPNKYRAIEESSVHSPQTIPLICSAEQQIHIENLIHRGINDVLEKYNKNKGDRLQTVYSALPVSVCLN